MNAAKRKNSRTIMSAASSAVNRDSKLVNNYVYIFVIENHLHFFDKSAHLFDNMF